MDNRGLPPQTSNSYCLPGRAGGTPMGISAPVDYVVGGPDTIRTCDLCLRRATLYPTELRVPQNLNPSLWHPPNAQGPVRSRPCPHPVRLLLSGQPTGPVGHPMRVSRNRLGVLPAVQPPKPTRAEPRRLRRRFHRPAVALALIQPYHRTIPPRHPGVNRIRRRPLDRRHADHIGPDAHEGDQVVGPAAAGKCQQTQYKKLVHPGMMHRKSK